MPVLNKFMCCCQLRTGAVVIGWVGLVMQLLSLASDSAIIANADSIFPKETVAITRVPLAVTLTCTIISILAHISLLWGANSKNRLFLLPWLIITMIIIVSSFLTVLILGIALGANGADGGIVAVIMIMGFLVIGIILYLWISILSLFQELQEDSSNDNKEFPYTYA